MDEIEVLNVEEKQDKNNKPNVVVIFIIVILIVICTLLGYFMFNKKNSNKDLENKLKKASTEYFEKYMSTNDSTSTYVVTLEMLKNANNQGENYDLKGLEACKSKSTLSRITINYNNGEPKNIEVELNC